MPRFDTLSEQEILACNYGIKLPRMGFFRSCSPAFQDLWTDRFPPWRGICGGICRPQQLDRLCGRARGFRRCGHQHGVC